MLDRGARGGEPPLAPRANYPLPLLHHHHYHHHRHHDHNYHVDYNDHINDHNDHNNHLNDNIAQANLVIIYILYNILFYTLSSSLTCPWTHGHDQLIIITTKLAILHILHLLFWMMIIFSDHFVFPAVDCCLLAENNCPVREVYITHGSQQLASFD